MPKTNCTELALIDDIAVLRVDNPPVNALSYPLRVEMAATFKALQSDESVQGLVFVCAGRGFIAGADINELGQIRAPMLLDLIAQFEGLPFPTVAAIHGNALGGGLELALAATFRVALNSARVGMPESNLGIIPGAGGTVRGTYLAGPAEIMRLAGLGKPVPSQHAIEIGLLDALFEDDLENNAISFLKDRIVTGDIPLPVRNRRGSARRFPHVPLRSN